MTFFTRRILLWNMKSWHFKEQRCGNFKCSFVSKAACDKAQTNGIYLYFLIFSLSKWPEIYWFSFFFTVLSTHLEFSKTETEKNSGDHYSAILDFAGGKNQICSLTLLRSLQTISDYFVIPWIYFWLFTQLLKLALVPLTLEPQTLPVFPHILYYLYPLFYMSTLAEILSFFEL